MDFFVLPNNSETEKSDFVRSQAWFEARDRCRDCGRLYNENLHEKNLAIGVGEISWEEYYRRLPTPCLLHSETLEAYLERTRGE